MQSGNNLEQPAARAFFQKHPIVLCLLLGIIFTVIFTNCHKDSHEPDCGCNAAIIDPHYTGIGHLTPAKDSLDQKIWIIEQTDLPGQQITFTICNLQDPIVKKVTDMATKDPIRVRFAGKIHEECPPEGAHIPEYSHKTMTVDTLSPIVMVPL